MQGEQRRVAARRPTSLRRSQRTSALPRSLPHDQATPTCAAHPLPRRDRPFQSPRWCDAGRIRRPTAPRATPDQRGTLVQLRVARKGGASRHPTSWTSTRVKASRGAAGEAAPAPGSAPDAGRSGGSGRRARTKTSTLANETQGARRKSRSRTGPIAFRTTPRTRDRVAPRTRPAATNPRHSARCQKQDVKNWNARMPVAMALRRELAATPRGPLVRTPTQRR